MTHYVSWVIEPDRAPTAYFSCDSPSSWNCRRVCNRGCFPTCTNVFHTPSVIEACRWAKYFNKKAPHTTYMGAPSAVQNGPIEVYFDKDRLVWRYAPLKALPQSDGDDLAPLTVNVVDRFAELVSKWHEMASIDAPWASLGRLKVRWRLEAMLGALDDAITEMTELEHLKALADQSGKGN